MPIGSLRDVDVLRVTRLVLASLWRIYLMLIIVAMLGQRWLIYPAPRRVMVPAISGLELLEIPGDNRRIIHAYHLPATGNAPTLVMFHGNGEQLSDTVPLAQEFSDRGLGVFAVEYPGYGLSSKYSTSEQSIYSDAERAILYLQKNLGIPREKTVIFGQSLGTAVAAEMAWRRLGSRLILVSPFTSMVDMASRTALILPTRWIVADRFDTLAKAPELSLPSLLIHGTLDTVVPLRMGLTLARSMPGVSLELVPGASHNDVYDVGGEKLIQRIIRFLGPTDPGEDTGRPLW